MPSPSGIDGGYDYFWAAAATVAAVHPEVMGNYDAEISVDINEGPTLGRTLVEPTGVNVRICEEFNPEIFEELFLKTILE